MNPYAKESYEEGTWADSQRKESQTINFDGTWHFEPAADYFFDKTCDRYVFVLDAMLGLQRYERISGNVRTRLVTEATDVSYAKSAQIVTGGSVSRQSVGNAIRKLTVLEKEPDWIEKKKVKELHVYADEDYVHLQKPKKEAGKKGKIVPLVSVTEG